MTTEFFNNKDLFLKTLIGVSSGIVEDDEYKSLIFKAPHSTAIFFEGSDDWYEVKGQRLQNKISAGNIELLEWEKRGKSEGIKIKVGSDGSIFWYDFSTLERLDLFFEKYTCEKEKDGGEDKGKKEISNETTRGHGIKSGKPT